jgi:acetyl-CoA C-acetyltransferase
VSALRRVAIIGVGCTRVGEHWSRSLVDLFSEAALASIEDGRAPEIDAVFVGNMFSGFAVHQEHLGSLLADSVGLSGCSAVKVEAACASGGVAMHQGFTAVASGMADFVLVGGVEKMTDTSVPVTLDALMMAENREYSASSGITFTGLNALVARLYMEKFGATQEEIASFAVNGHRNAVNNEFAQFRSSITVEQVLRSALVADPLHVLDCCGIGDGAAAAVLCPLDRAREFCDTPVEVAASSVATNVLSLCERDDPLSFDATRRASSRSFHAARLSPRDVDVLEVHDAFTIVGVLSLEALGFAAVGEGARFASSGGIALDGAIPTNTFGGLKARGHPVGATGIYQIVELFWQLTGRAGKNQVDGARIGVAQNVGGVDSTSAVHILRRVDG